MNVRTTYEGGDIHPFTFEWKLPSGEKKSVVTLTPQSGFQMPQIHDHYPMMFLTAATQFIPEENAKRFSFLSRRHRDTSVLKVIQSIFPLVQDLSVEIVSGSPNLYATVSGLDEKMSIGALSGGLTKFLAIAFGIASFPRGAVLIDEIENGFFYKKYADVWKGITELAEENETQMFISSHSIECLQAALPVISQHPSLFTLLRTERRPEQCVVRYFSGKDFEAGIEQRVDFR
jgi:AAA15 family ATPase/GTPase